MTEEVGMIEPTARVLLIQPLKKRISSSNFLPSRSFTFTRNVMPSPFMVAPLPASGVMPARIVRLLRICDAVCVKNKSDCAVARKFLASGSAESKEPAGRPAGS